MTAGEIQPLAAKIKIQKTFDANRVAKPRWFNAPVRGKNSLPKIMVRVVEGASCCRKLIADDSGFGNHASGFSGSSFGSEFKFNSDASVIAGQTPCSPQSS